MKNAPICQQFHRKLFLPYFYFVIFLIQNEICGLKIITPKIVIHAFIQTNKSARRTDIMSVVHKCQFQHKIHNSA